MYDVSSFLDGAHNYFSATGLR